MQKRWNKNYKSPSDCVFFLVIFPLEGAPITGRPLFFYEQIIVAHAEAATARKVQQEQEKLEQEQKKFEQEQEKIKQEQEKIEQERERERLRS